MQSEEWEDISDFKVSKTIFLGKGQSCEVFYGYNKKTGQKVASKKIDICKINPRMEKQIENEIKNLEGLTSPFIVRMLGYYRFGNFLYIFLEYCEDLDLKRYLEKSKKRNGVCEAEALMFMRHIIQGYKELYKNNIIHRDIKPANILMKQGIAKLSDFGFSRVVPNPDSSEKFTLLGTPLYTAPQILRGDQFSSKCDVWSVGVVFYEMLYGKLPWVGDNLQDLRKNIDSKPLEFGEIKRKEQIKDLLRRMLKLNSKERITWKQIFDFELFQDQLPKMSQEPKGYEDLRNIFTQYVRSNIVKSYLRFNMHEVNFKEPMEPTETAHIELIKTIQNRITHRRNIAFMYAYMLILYYKNVSIIPNGVNQNMEFEFALTMKAFSLVGVVGATYFNKDPTDYPPAEWATFKKSASYEELKKVLMTDFKILQKMIEHMKREAEKRHKAGKISKDVVKWFNLIEKNLNEGFHESMKLNLKEISKGNKNGIIGLLCYYIELGVNPKQLQENQLFDFGSFYEQRQKAYGLS